MGCLLVAGTVVAVDVRMAAGLAQAIDDVADFCSVRRTLLHGGNRVAVFSGNTLIRTLSVDSTKTYQSRHP